jgi:hypothetical protein
MNRPEAAHHDDSELVCVRSRGRKIRDGYYICLTDKGSGSFDANGTLLGAFHNEALAERAAQQPLRRERRSPAHG